MAWYPIECEHGYDHCPKCDKDNPMPMAPEIPAARILDEFGFPIPTEPKAAISPEDLELTKRFLGNLKDQTLSRGVHKVLTDLLERLP